MKRDFDTTRRLYLQEFKTEFNMLNLDLELNEIGLHKIAKYSIIENQRKLRSYVQTIKILENETLTKEYLIDIIINFRKYFYFTPA